MLGKSLGMVAAVLALIATSSHQGAALETPRGKQAGDLVLGLGGVAVLPQQGGRTTIGGEVRATDSGSPLLDVTYFLLPRVSLNLIAATTQHDVRAIGTALGDVRLGHIWVLPPTVTAQYHILPNARFSPYVGFGINATFYYGYGGDRSPGINKLRLDTAVGPSFNLGFDYEITPNWLLNLDAKKIIMRPTLSINSGAVTGRAELDPWVVGAAVRYRF